MSNEESCELSKDCRVLKCKLSQRDRAFSLTCIWGQEFPCRLNVSLCERNILTSCSLGQDREIADDFGLHVGGGKINGAWMSGFTVPGDKRHMHFAHHKMEPGQPHLFYFLAFLQHKKCIC